MCGFVLHKWVPEPELCRPHVEDIRLVIVHTEDLSLQVMRQKVGDLLPLGDLTPHGALIDFLESECRTHRREAINGKFSTPVRAGATGPQAGRTKTAT